MAVLLAVSGCSDRVYLDRPLGHFPDEPSGAVCAPFADERETFAGNVGPLMHEQGRVPVTITGVSLVGARGMRLVDAVLTPENGTASGAAYPPESEVNTGPAWDQRIPAEGAVIEPGETWWLVVGLRAENRHAGVEHIEVDYRDAAGARYRFRAGKSYYLLPDCDEDWQGWGGGL
ncbi:hypothetical protein [Saccharomonospora iraqiensis]|uniref:hypothetical protein n=1 Tax=Saccharomonospora iraqiensis TaxID=52698 RepID=UPI00022DF88A|nr:hypothetical protein [Saccharomonospora iraqiensis]